jgi:hypothetical protein
MARMKDKYNLEEASLSKKKQIITSKIVKKQQSPFKDGDMIVRREAPTLKKILKRNRVDKLVRNFCLKMKRNITSTNPQIDENEPQKSHSKSPLKKWMT